MSGQSKKGKKGRKSRKRTLEQLDHDDNEPCRKKMRPSSNTKDPEPIATNDYKNECDNLILSELLYERSQIKHLNHRQRILLLGDGDLSFSASLCRLGFTNLVATTYQDYKSMIAEHYNAEYNIQLIQRTKNTVHHSIDITQIHKHLYFSALKDDTSKFDAIVFNFPHSGLSNYEYKTSIPSNQALLRSIFEHSLDLLKDSGELHIALKSEPIYNSWDIQQQCKSVDNSLALKKRIPFRPELFFGYQHKTTANHTSVASNASYVWIFGKYGKGVTTDWTPMELPTGQKFSVGMYKCKTCNLGFNSQKRFEMHINSKKHSETKHSKNVEQKSKKKKKKAKTNGAGKKRF